MWRVTAAWSPPRDLRQSKVDATNNGIASSRVGPPHSDLSTSTRHRPLQPRHPSGPSWLNLDPVFATPRLFSPPFTTRTQVKSMSGSAAAWRYRRCPRPKLFRHRNRSAAANVARPPPLRAVVSVSAAENICGTVSFLHRHPDPTSFPTSLNQGHATCAQPDGFDIWPTWRSTNPKRH